jgi:CBS domain-containing protein
LTTQWGSIGETGFVAHELAGKLAAIVLGAVAIFEIFGPLMTKWCAVRAGEVKALALISRSRPVPAEGQSSTAIIVQSLFRMLGLARKIEHHATEQLTVKHIMRTNVKLLPASANLDDVLHFVERSRFNTFPTVDEEGKLVGMVKFTDIHDIIYDPASRALITAADLADSTMPTAHVNQSLEELLEVFRDKHVSAMPVTESSDSLVVIGIVEQRDLLRALHVTMEKESQESS